MGNMGKPLHGSTLRKQRRGKEENPPLVG